MRVMPGAEPFHHEGSAAGASAESSSTGSVGVLVGHGFTSTPQSMRGLAEHLAAQGYGVSLPPLPGHGTRWQDLNRTTWADWFTRLEQELLALAGRCDRVVVVGLSMGGTLAARLAQVHPEAVHALVLINPVFRVDDPRLRALPLVKHLVPSLDGLANDIRRTGGPAELAYDRTPLKALHSQVRRWPEVAAGLAEVTQPVLLLRSAEDHVVPAVSSEVLLARLGSRDVTEVVLHDSYHVATLDHDAQKVLDATTDFIARVTDS